MTDRWHSRRKDCSRKIWLNTTTSIPCLILVFHLLPVKPWGLSEWTLCLGDWAEKQGSGGPRTSAGSYLGHAGLKIQRINQAWLPRGRTGSEYLVVCVVSYSSVVVLFSHSVVPGTLWPHGLQHSRFLEIAQMFIQSVMLSNHLILCHPFLLLPSVFPSSGYFLISWFIIRCYSISNVILCCEIEIISLLSRLKNQGSEELSNLSEITQLVSGRVGIYMSICLTLNFRFLSSTTNYLQTVG